MGVNADVRAMLAKLAPGWSGRPVYVGCSGSFTVEATLAKAGTFELHGNDVSLYACAVGARLTGGPDPVVTVRPEADEWDWLEEFLEPGMATVATVAICRTMLSEAMGSGRYFERQRDGYRRQFAALHERSLARCAKALDGLTLASFTPGDVVDFLDRVPDEAAVVVFPPTSTASERMAEAMGEILDWDAPVYPARSVDDLGDAVSDRLSGRSNWVTVRDGQPQIVGAHLVGRFQVTRRQRPAHLYADDASGAALTVPPPQKVEPVLIRRREAMPEGPLSIVDLTQGQFVALRSQYLNPGIAAMQIRRGWAVCSGGELIGAFAVGAQITVAWADAYLASDFGIRPTAAAHLAKLVLAAIVSHEGQAALQQCLNKRVRSIGTTAFTRRPSSAKYRGLFELRERLTDPPRLMYRATAGRWSLAEAHDWWWENHGDARNP